MNSSNQTTDREGRVMLTEPPINRYNGYNPEFVKRVMQKRREAQRAAQMAKVEAERLARAEERKRLQEIHQAKRQEEKREQKRLREKAEAEAAKAKARAMEEKATQEISELPRHPVNDDISVKGIIHEVATRFGVEYRDIVGLSRSRSIVKIRWVAIAEVRRRKPHLSLPQIGKAFNRDHTTVLHALQQMEQPTAFEETPTVALTPAKVDELLRRGFDVDGIAGIFGCDPMTIYRVIRKAA